MTGNSRTPAWGPSELADRCEALGARVTMTGNQYRVYPPNGGRPVFFDSGRDSRGSHLPNVLRDLRHGGLDLVGAWEEEQRTKRPAPRPQLERPVIDQGTVAAVMAKLAESSTPTTAPTTKEATVADPKPTALARIPFDARREMAELREMIRSQDASHLEMMAQADARIRSLEDQLADIMAGRTVRPPSTSELVRRVVLAWFEEHPGMKITPQLLEMNLNGQLPEKTSKTMVAGACRELALAGKLNGGGPRVGDATGRGVYWLAEPAAEPEKTETED